MGKPSMHERAIILFVGVVMIFLFLKTVFL